MSAGGGKGSGSTTQVVDSAAANTLAKLAEQFTTETAGVRTGLIDTMKEVLSTGGSTIPIISRAVESTRREASKATEETEEDLARNKLAGTPFGEMIRANAKREGNIAAGQTQQSLASAIFNLIPNFILGQSQTALSGLAGAVPGMNTTSGRETAKGFGVGFGR